MLEKIFFGFGVCSVTVRLLLAVVVGGIIGIERAMHGRAAGMRTHILVCLGSALTALCGVYCAEVLGYEEDISRIAAQVISGIGFLGAGMILVKNNSIIVGLTTAAGMWTTAVIGIAIGFGFYTGALIAALLFFAATVLLARFERKKLSEIIYVELDDIRAAGRVVKEITALLGGRCHVQIIPAKSGIQGHIGIEMNIENSVRFDAETLCGIPNVVLAIEE